MRVADADRPALEVLKNNWLTANDAEFVSASLGLTIALAEPSPHQAKLVVFHLSPERITHIVRVLKGETGIPLLGLDSQTQNHAESVRWIGAALTRVHDAAKKELP